MLNFSSKRLSGKPSENSLFFLGLKTDAILECFNVFFCSPKIYLPLVQNGVAAAIRQSIYMCKKLDNLLSYTTYIQRNRDLQHLQFGV